MAMAPPACVSQVILSPVLASHSPPILRHTSIQAAPHITTRSCWPWGCASTGTPALCNAAARPERPMPFTTARLDIDLDIDRSLVGESQCHCTAKIVPDDGKARVRQCQPQRNNYSW